MKTGLKIRELSVTRWADSVFAGVMVSIGLWSVSASAESFPRPNASEDVVGQIRVVRTHYEDTLSDIARAHHVGYEEIVAANPHVDPWLPGEGAHVIVPRQYLLPRTPREGLVLNLPEMRLYYYPRAAAGQTPEVITFPVSIGRMDWATPLGRTRVTGKVVNPAWYPPESIRAEHAADGRELPLVVEPGPDNPLGEYALQLAVPGYLIHGTNRPYGVGMRVTHGCIRLYPEDIARLFQEIPVGTPVRIVNQPYKAGWRDGRLYFEAHPPLEEFRSDDNNYTAAVEAVIAATATRPISVAWERVLEYAEAARGIPLAISD